MTETNHVLASGGWVTLCEPAQVPEKYMRRARNAALGLSTDVREVIAEGITAAKSLKGKARSEFIEKAEERLGLLMSPEDAEVFQTQNDLTASALIVAWSFGDDGKHPSADEITELAAGDYREIQKLVAPYASQIIQGEDFGTVPAEVNPDTPTGPSGA